MKSLLKSLFALVFSILLLASCKDKPLDGPDLPDVPVDQEKPEDPGKPVEPEMPEYFQIGGCAQKGPLNRGSKVTVFVYDDELRPTGNAYPTDISDDLGSFALEVKKDGPYMELSAEGYYFNEVSGEISEAPVYLKAFGRSESSELNVNLFTTLITPRIKKLITSGKTYEESVKTAQEEFLSTLGVNVEAVDFSDMDITGDSASDAVMLAYSCMIQQNRSTGEMVSLIQNIASDFEKEGSLSQSLVEAIYAGASDVNPFKVAENIAEYYAEKSIAEKGLPAFYKYLDEEYDRDFMIDRETFVSSPDRPENAEISASYDILSTIDFDVVCSEDFVVIEKNHILGPLYTVNVHIPENNGVEERVASVHFKDKSGNVFESEEFSQGAYVQYVHLLLDSGTKTTLSTFRFPKFMEGDVVFVNGKDYDLEVLSTHEASVKLPVEDSYFFSYPDGSVEKADHIARVTIDIPEEITSSTPVPYYAGLESWNDMPIPDRAEVQLRPAVAIVGFMTREFADVVDHMVIEGNDYDDYLSGKFTYVPYVEDLHLCPDLNPEVVKGDGYKMTLRYSDGDYFYAILPPFEFPSGFTITIYDKTGEELDTVKLRGSLSFNAGSVTLLKF